jgi:hypothetical protein
MKVLLINRSQRRSPPINLGHDPPSHAEHRRLALQQRGNVRSGATTILLFPFVFLLRVMPLGLCIFGPELRSTSAITLWIASVTAS